MHSAWKWLLITVAGGIITTAIGHLVSPEVTKQAISLPLTRLPVPVWGLIVIALLAFFLGRHLHTDLPPSDPAIHAVDPVIHSNPPARDFSSAEKLLLAYLQRQQEAETEEDMIESLLADNPLLTSPRVSAALRALRAEGLIDRTVSTISYEAVYRLTQPGFDIAEALARE